MKFLVLLLGIIFGIENGSFNFNLRNNERENLISIIAENEAEFALANCYCRIGNDVGSRVNEYPNSLKDFGHIASYGGIIVTNSMEEDCGRKCAIKAADWLNLLSNDELCNYVKKQGSQRILAYAKVGGRKWNVRGSGKSASCCGNGGAYYCPSGWEYDSNPKKCKRLACTVPSPGYNHVLKDKDGNEWGFIYNNSIFQMIQPSISPVIWKACN